MTVTLRELKADIRVTEESSDKSDVNPVYFADEDGVMYPMGDLIWDDDNDCWVFTCGEDDGDDD